MRWNREGSIDQQLDELRAAVDALGCESSLDGIAFASDEAAELAIEAELTADDFAGVEPSGKSGYTAADVRALTADE